MLEPLNIVSDVPVAGLADIGLMKLDAIAARGRRKDFIDLYFIVRHISLDELLTRSKEKYPYARHFVTRSLESLVEFEIAERESNPQMLVPMDWDRVKEFCINEAVRVGKKWFGDE